MKKPHYIPTLDGWRALAIGLVIGTHSVPALEELHHPLSSLLAHFFSHAGYGVDIFFSLSGYLICTLLLEEKRRLDGRIDLGRFYTRRAFRILPPMVAYLAVLVVLHAVGQVDQLGRSEVVAVLAFFRNYSGGGWYTGHFWSLAIEEHFYLIIPLLLAILRWRPALALAVGLSAASVAWRAIESHHGIVQSSLPWTLAQFRTENRFDGLMNGAILALLLHRPKIREWFSKVLSPAMVIALIAGAIAAEVYFTSQPSRRTIAALCFPLLIAHTVLRPGTFAGRLLELPSVRWIGRLSFSLYLWQQLFLIPEYLEIAPNPLGWCQRSLLSIIPTVACAVVSYYLVERPMFRLGHRLAASPTAPVAASRPGPAEDGPASASASAIDRLRSEPPGAGLPMS